MKRMFWAGILSWVVSVCGAVTPPPDLKGEEVFSEWKAIRDTASAQRCIRPMSHTENVRSENSCVVFPVSFTKNQDERASWDIFLRADLRLCRGVQFDFYCESLDPFSCFSVYFKSGKGWYHSEVSVEESGRWQRVCVDKASCRHEGEVSGWQDISAIRISGWRTADLDTVCAMANLAPLDSRSEVMIICADSLMHVYPEEARGFSGYAKNLESSLSRLGLRTTVLSDIDVSEETLRTAKLICLPYNPSLPTNALSCLKTFLARGGRMMVFYSLPKALEGALGVKKIGMRNNKTGFLGFVKSEQGIAGQPAFSPQASRWTSLFETSIPSTPLRRVAFWRDDQGKETELPAISLSPRCAFFGHVWFGGSLEEPTALMRAVVGEVMPEFRERFIQMARKKAEKDARDRKWIASVPARKGEHRAFWCHSPWGVAGKTWDESIRILKENGFTAIMVNLAWGASASYPSSVLPLCPDSLKRGDALTPCLAACRKYGVQCHAWKVCWHTFWCAPEGTLQTYEKAGRSLQEFSGKVKNGWLCPSHPLNRDMEVNAMVELAGKGLDGVHFDYIRYQDNNGCFCDGCRTRFEKTIGHAVTNWPACVRGELAGPWENFRCEQINEVVRRASEIVHRRYPSCIVSAAVFGNWPGIRKSIGQDWAMWCREGWLDVVCPMDYTESVKGFRNQILRQKKIAGKAKLYPGIGLSCWKDRQDAVRLTKQIQAVREEGISGFTIFNYDTSSVNILPVLHSGPTAE